MTVGWAGGAGWTGRWGAINDQWAWYSAPSATQRFRVSFWAAVSFLCDFLGGISSEGESAKMRSTRGLSSTLPGTKAPALTACSRISSRRSALRAAVSAPWQAKQFSTRMGRISRLYCSFSAEKAGTTEAQSQREDQSQLVRMDAFMTCRSFLVFSVPLCSWAGASGERDSFEERPQGAHAPRLPGAGRVS